jgi:hypothetical protein
MRIPSGWLGCHREEASSAMTEGLLIAMEDTHRSIGLVLVLLVCGFVIGHTFTCYAATSKAVVGIHIIMPPRPDLADPANEAHNPLSDPIREAVRPAADPRMERSTTYIADGDHMRLVTDVPIL